LIEWIDSKIIEGSVLKNLPENATGNFQRKIRAGFHQLYPLNDKRWFLIDAS
jgi:hypothetical protein